MIYRWAWKRGFVFFSLLSHLAHTALALCWFHPLQHVPPRPAMQHIQLQVICSCVTPLPLLYLTTDHILQKRNKVLIVLPVSLSSQSARKSLTGLVLKTLFLSIVSLWKKKKYSWKRWVLNSGFKYAELGELALSTGGKFHSSGPGLHTRSLYPAPQSTTFSHFSSSTCNNNLHSCFAA